MSGKLTSITTAIALSCTRIVLMVDILDSELSDINFLKNINFTRMNLASPLAKELERLSIY
jgi:hypothetical protein